MSESNDRFFTPTKALVLALGLLGVSIEIAGKRLMPSCGSEMHAPSAQTSSRPSMPQSAPTTPAPRSKIVTKNAEPSSGANAESTIHTEQLADDFDEALRLVRQQFDAADAILDADNTEIQILADAQVLILEIM
ncbi:hypothetical protein COW94_04815 [Candidatus Peregrinibacteria bacterium CG22_combo_CG10-13_8_21_14_all_44_10]|nr:MAG: hypothetical protein AUK45_01010 [Candidatus Peregrinibacteria bacterium CG2_30_44_17]PIP65855.1 MAG: hypothetical protein COW94_04815 [Candidatus Peregrinibacteria bacterium CG22_combo_CG10-13_8_21_14_all_44_10]PIS03595.1 MAG: hypothetical protein COT83_05275 [Candidatus Peregrinibacteria bacterium CG10_big_fil_rev_8_21_14_0_10_44_7]PIX80610.1 MAG: hypothetical protein COZ35_00205 [Candidatus Peregrinibacteria bacterium CG_4_10_14_3_um_filter_44_21]PJB89609.1 MAG: hypothetical protein 